MGVDWGVAVEPEGIRRGNSKKIVNPQQGNLMFCYPPSSTPLLQLDWIWLGIYSSPWFQKSSENHNCKDYPVKVS